MQDGIHPKQLTGAGEPRARRRNTRERGPGGWMRGKLAEPDARRRARRAAPRPPLGRAPQPAGARRARARPRRAPADRGRSRSPSACAPTACPTSQTQAPDAERSSRYLLESTRHRPRSGRRRRSARSSWAAAPLGSGRTHPSAQTLAKLLRIAVCMRQHGVSQFPDPRTTVPSNHRARHQRDHRFRRSDPSVPGNDEHAGAGVQAGPDRVRRAATWPPALTVQPRGLRELVGES